jgi:hypothetical protein
VNAPTFKPDRNSQPSPSIGDLVSLVNSRGEEVVGKVASVSMGGTYKVVANGVEHFKQAKDLNPISEASAPTMDSVAAHLQSGGQAFYTPSRDRYGPDSGELDFENRDQAHERIPLHSTWLGKKENLGQFVNFEDVASGKASIDMARPEVSPPSKHEPIDRMHDLELKHFLKKGDPKGFNTFPESDRTSKFGQHSLNDMLGDKSLATDENIKTWIEHARKAAADRKATVAPREGAPPAGSNGSLNTVQNTLDGVGFAGDAVIPGAGVAADGTNAVVSLLRAATDSNNRGTHLRNAAISGASMVPFIGDAAKLLKHGGGKAYGDGGGSGGGSNGGNGESVSGAAGDGEDPLSESSDSTKEKLLQFAGVIGKASIATIAASNSISLLNRAAIEYHRDLSKYNGEIAEAYGKLDTDRTVRSIREGSNMSGSLPNLIRAQSSLEESTQNFSAPFKQMAVDVQTVATYAASFAVSFIDLIEPFSEMYPLMRKAMQSLIDWVGWPEKEADKKIAGEWMEGVRKKSAEDVKKARKL